MISQVRFHGSPQDVPAAFREVPPISVEQAKLSRNQLLAQKSELDHRLSPILDKIQSGVATTEEMAAVADLGDDSRILADRLHRANIELQVAQEIQDKKDANARRDRFDDLVIETRRQRSEFARLFKQTCIVLGQLCSAVDEASKIANASIGIAGMNPLDRNSIAEMSERVDPLPPLLDAGFSPTTGFGWDLRIAVVPLKGKI